MIAEINGIKFEKQQCKKCMRTYGWPVLGARPEIECPACYEMVREAGVALHEYFKSERINQVFGESVNGFKMAQDIYNGKIAGVKEVGTISIDQSA